MGVAQDRRSYKSSRDPEGVRMLGKLALSCGVDTMSEQWVPYSAAESATAGKHMITA
jgi:hypothetical protein